VPVSPCPVFSLAIIQPLRAGTVVHPRDYPWSSYRRNAEGKANPLIQSHHEYERLGMTLAERPAAYRQLFSAHIDPEHVAEIRAATNGMYILGNNRFKEEISRMLKRRVTKDKAGRPARGNSDGG